MAKDNTLNGNLSMLETEIEKLVLNKKVPALPDNIKEIMVKLSPYFAVIGVIMVAPLLLGALGISAVTYPFAYLAGTRLGFSYTLSLVFSAVMLILEAMAIPGLFKRQLKAWRLMYYATLVSLVQSLLSFNLVSMVISAAISFYLLFQIKAKYTK